MKKNQAEKLYDLKDFVKQKCKDTDYKFKKLKDEESRQKYFLEKCSEIRLEIDQLTKDGNSQQSDENLNQNKSLQLGQVKMILTSFLQSAGKQMKASEKELVDVVDIINQKESIMPQSTNSLIIKLWNTILTSVSEFKATYVKNQSGISQQLGIMDGKLDSIMDSIEAGKNEVLLELYKISKVQDMALEKSQEKIDIREMLAQAKKIQFDTYKLSQTNIQLPVFDIQKMSSHLIPTQLSHTNLNLSHASLISQMEESKFSKKSSLQAKRQWKLNANPKLCKQFNDKGDAHLTIILCQNGNIVVGGKDNKLYQYSSEFKQLQVKHIDGYLRNGIAIGEQLYCAIEKQLMILDQNTLNTINTINTQSYVYKMLLVDDYLILGQYEGYLDIISISQQKNIHKTQLQYGHIMDIVKLNNNEYAFACEKGLYLGNITHDNQQIIFKQNIDEYYFKDQYVFCVQNVKQHLLIVGIQFYKQLQLVDRQSKQVIKQIGQFDGHYHAILNYDEQSLPYLIVKDMNNITIINTNTYDIVSTTNCRLYYYSWKSSVAYKQIDSKLYLFTLTNNDQQRGIQQLEIANLQ